MKNKSSFLDHVSQIIHDAESQGVQIRLANPGKLRLTGPAEAVEKIKPLVLEHKAAIVRELIKTPLPIPEPLESALLNCGYRMPEWNPEGCRQFLDRLQTEWPDFHVNGWHGCEFPACWPVELMDAVQSIYVMSIQNQGDAA